MQWFTLRPTYEIPLENSRSEAVEKIAAAYQHVANRKPMLVFGEYGEPHFPQEEHRLWSPHFSFSIDQRDKHAFIYARFAPRIEIWTFVWICYTVFALTAFFGFILGFSQFVIGASTWGTWIGCAAVLLWASLIIVAHARSEWSADQMRTLQTQLEEFLRSAQVRLSDHSAARD